MSWNIIGNAMNDIHALRLWMKYYCGWENIEGKVLGFEEGTYGGGVYFAAIRPESGEAHALVLLVEKHPEEGYLVNAIPEDEGPGYYDCPKSILEKLDPVPDKANGYAKQWREQVEAFHLTRHDLLDLEDGTVVKFREPIVITKSVNLLDHFKEDEFIIHVVKGERFILPVIRDVPRETQPFPAILFRSHPFTIVD